MYDILKYVAKINFVHCCLNNGCRLNKEIDFKNLTTLILAKAGMLDAVFPPHKWDGNELK
jgi:hypothetical protein